MTTFVSRQRFRRTLLLGVLVLVPLLGFAQPLGLAAASQEAAVQAVRTLPIADQEKVLFDALARAMPEVTAKYGPDVAAQVKALCVGSWCIPGKAKITSDLDLTIGHPNPEVAKFLSGRVNTIANDLAKERGGAHNIKVIFDGDAEFKELFSGKTGETFIYEYAKANSLEGKGALTFARDANGEWVREWASVDEYWKGLGRAIPHEIVQPQVFAQEAATMMQSAVKNAGTTMEAAEKVAKYMGFVENIVKPGFERQWGLLPAETAVGSRTASQMQTILDIKNAGERLTDAEKGARLAKAFGAGTDEELEAALKRFVSQGDAYFAKTTRDLAVFDELYRMGALNEVGDLAQASLTLGTIVTVLGPTIGHTIAAADLALILHAVRSGDDQAAAEQMANSLLAYGLPQAAVGALVTKLTLELGVKLPANYFLFDPINDRALASVFDPQSAWYILGPDVIVSPFKTLGVKSIDTLACTIKTTDRQVGASQISSLVDEYVDNLTSIRSDLNSVAFSENEGALRDKLKDVMVAAWHASQEKRKGIEQLEYNIYFKPTKTPAKPPLWVWVDRQPIGGGQNPTIIKTTGAGQRASFRINLARDFGTITVRKTPPKPGIVVDQWCQLGGTNSAFKAWLDKTLPNEVRHESGFQPVLVGTSVGGARGWTVEGGGALGLSTASSGGAALLLKSDEGKLASAQRAYTVSFVQGPEAKQPVMVSFDFRLQDDFDSPPTQASVTLIVNPIAAPVEPSEKGLTDALDNAKKKVEAGTKAPSGPTPKPEAIAPQAACDCVGRWQTTIYQAQLFASCRAAEGSACLAYEVRIGKPWTYDAAKNVCVGSFVQTRHMVSTVTHEPYWNVQGGGNDVELTLAHARERCEELGQAAATPKPN
jgi:hypothetical protein